MVTGVSGLHGRGALRPVVYQQDLSSVEQECAIIHLQWMVGNSVLVMTEKVFDLALRLVQVRMAHFHMTHEP